jgi:hypothetical protein
MLVDVDVLFGPSWAETRAYVGTGQAHMSVTRRRLREAHDDDEGEAAMAAEKGCVTHRIGFPHGQADPRARGRFAVDMSPRAD